MGRQLDGLFEGDVAHLSGQYAFHFLVGMVLHDDFRGQRGLRGVGQGQGRLYEGILEGDFPGAGELDVIPDADVASAHCRNPVPADGGMESRVVRSQDASVEVRALLVLFLDGADVFVLDDFHGQYVLAFLQEVRHVKLPADEGTFQASGFLSVQVDIGFPVDAVEVQRHAIALEALRHFKLVAVPEVGVEEGFGRYQLVVRIIEIGQGACLDIAAQYRAGHRGHHPSCGLIVRRGDHFSALCHFGCPLHLPVSAGQVHFPVGNGGHGCRLGHQASAAHHFYLAQHVGLSVGRFFHQDAHESSLSLHVQDIVWRIPARKFAKVLPILGIVRGLYLALHGLVDPVQVNLVEGRARTQVHTEPFRAAGGAHPGAGEELRGFQVHLSVLVGEGYFVEDPFVRAFHLQVDAVIGVGGFLREVERLVQPAYRHGDVARLLVGVVHGDASRRGFAGQAASLVAVQHGPFLTVVRAFPRHFIPALGHLVVKGQCAGDGGPADGFRIVLQGELEIGVFALHVVSRIRASVYHPFPFPFGLVACGGGERQVAGLFFRHDAVRRQLGSQVVVISRRLRGGTHPGQVAVLIGIREQLRREILFRVSRINADPAGVVVRADE